MRAVTHSTEDRKVLCELDNILATYPESILARVELTYAELSSLRRIGAVPQTSNVYRGVELRVVD